jgi:hypothetical protein
MSVKNHATLPAIYSQTPPGSLRTGRNVKKNLRDSASLPDADC